MSYGGIKTYHVIVLDFWKKKYLIFEYQKDRRLTSRQRISLLYHPSIEPIKEGTLGERSSMFDYDRIVEEMGYDIKYCDLQMRFTPLI